MTPEKFKRSKKEIKAEESKEQAIRMSNIRTSGLYNAALSIMSIHCTEDLDPVILRDDLKDQIESVLNGNTRRMEIMLITQAQTLNSLFHFAAAKISRAENLPQIDAYTNLAIKANNACRKSLLAISQIKNPAKATFIKQQNNAVNQQINNSASEPQILKNSEENCSNKLLLSEVTDEKLDNRSTSQTSGDYSSLAALEESGRKNARRQSN